jgi:hypothetical protein
MKKRQVTSGHPIQPKLKYSLPRVSLQSLIESNSMEKQACLFFTNPVGLLSIVN